jgi:transcriptional repressor NF-X1
VAWAQTQEREFRVFAGDSKERRLRFKPMQSNQRAFLHSLAEDFGLDSESQDPEPHRHVCIFKTPRFVSAPRKTMSQCIKIRSTQAAADAAASRSGGAGASSAANEPFNALLLLAPKFGLTIDEVEAALAAELTTYPLLNFNTSFLPSEEVVIRASLTRTWGAPTPSAVEDYLTTLKASITKIVTSLGLAKSVALCRADSSLNILRREASASGAGARAGGWNTVVSRSRQSVAAETAPPEALPVARRLVGLRREQPAKKKAEEEPVEDDWEAAAENMGDS